LDALHSERRDRSILFWKSLPVSDQETVLSKLTVPMAVLPVVTFAVALAAQLLIFLIENGTMLVHGGSLRALWTQLPIPAALTAFLYGLITTTLWYAPIYAWLMLISAWARRAALLWAIVPFFVLAIFEKIAFHTNYVVDLMKYRISGGFLAAFAQDPSLHRNSATIPLSDLTPGHFFASPGLWTGLLFAALVVILLIRMRRSSEPI
jgi:ABC-2 type transport system permease protein